MVAGPSIFSSTPRKHSRRTELVQASGRRWRTAGSSHVLSMKRSIQLTKPAWGRLSGLHLLKSVAAVPLFAVSFLLGFSPLLGTPTERRPTSGQACVPRDRASPAPPCGASGRAACRACRSRPLKPVEIQPFPAGPRVLMTCRRCRRRWLGCRRGSARWGSRCRWWCRRWGGEGAGVDFDAVLLLGRVVDVSWGDVDDRDGVVQV
jgi:hypothetical protein